MLFRKLAVATCEFISSVATTDRRNCNPNRKARVMVRADCYDQTRFETMHLSGSKILASIPAHSARNIRKKACAMHAY